VSLIVSHLQYLSGIRNQESDSWPETWYNVQLASNRG
jgi:hypothetical protein